MEIALGSIDPFHDHFHAPIIEQNRGIFRNFFRQQIVSDGACVLSAHHFPAGEHEGIALLQHDRPFSKFAEPNFRALKVLQNRHRLI